MDAISADKLAAQIRAARRARGWSQDDLRRSAGVSKTVVVNLEKGRTASDRLRVKVMDALGIERSILDSADPYTAVALHAVMNWLGDLSGAPERQAALEHLLGAIKDYSGHASN